MKPKEIIQEGGDVDTNTCLAGAVIGCFMDYNHLSKKAISTMRNVAWLKAWNQKIDYQSLYVENFVVGGLDEYTNSWANYTIRVQSISTL